MKICLRAADAERGTYNAEHIDGESSAERRSSPQRRNVALRPTARPRRVSQLAL